MSAIDRSRTPSNAPSVSKQPIMSLGAIDNSLSWPWKHPDAWRSFPFGWLFLPVSLIGQPFSQKTRDHFLPLLTSTDWWSETQLALRQVFEQDSDFKERMFEGQIAVMKGQAWNVVETLKNPDHGPLELTRRTRVCVWDELVEIPVAIPLRTPSAEMRRRTDNVMQRTEEEEMDISSANGVSRAQPDLMKFSSESTDLPNPNRFDLSRNPSSSDLGHLPESMEPPTLAINGVDQSSVLNGSPSRHARPGNLKSTTRVSFESHRRRGSMSGGRRHHSHSTRHGNNSFLYDGDEDEGDLGFAAAEEREGDKRKVIVERLETVKSKNPVFSWC